MSRGVNSLAAVTCVVFIACGGLAAAVAADKPKAKPAPTLKDIKDRKVEVRAGEPVDSNAAKAMENYQEFLELKSDDPKLRAEATRRLGDLNLEASEIERAEKEQVSTDSLRATEAIKLYNSLLKEHPNFPAGDAVLYQLARAYDSNAQSEKALATLDNMVKRFPGSRLIDEAQFRRGELLFSAQRYNEAESAYAEVVRRGTGSTFYEQSLYKQGWALFKLARNEDSLNAFGQLLDRTLIDPRDRTRIANMQAMTRPQRELLDDTLRVMSITFSYLDGAQSVDAFVGSRNSPPYTYLLYSNLGDLYIGKERYQDAAQTYEAFVEKNPVHVQAPLLQVRVIEAYRKGGFSSLVIAGKQDFVERYGFGTAFWQGRDAKQFPEVVKELKTNLKELASYYHSAAQAATAKAAAAPTSAPKSKDATAAQSVADPGASAAAAVQEAQTNYRLAARWYRSYLQWFPGEAESAETNFLLAEALYESRQFSDATAEYERTAYEYPAHARSAESAYAALLAYDRQEKLLSGVDAAGAERAAWHQRGVESGLKFATAFPTHKEAPTVLTRTAKELFDLKDYDRAVDVAQRVLALPPGVDAESGQLARQRTALTVVAHSRFEQAQFAAAESAYLQLRRAIPANDKEQASITDKLAAAVYKQAEEKKAAGNAAGAVDDFLRVSRVAPGSGIGKSAEYDAAAALVNLKDWPRAIQVLEAFRNGHPQDPLVAEATKSLAIAYVETKQPQRAAAEFEKIAASDAETLEVKREALWRAASLYGEAKDRSGAARAYETFIQRFSGSAYSGAFDQTLEARKHLADMAVEVGDNKQRDRWLAGIIDMDAKAGAARTERSKSLAAQATLTLAEPAGQAFKAVRLSAPLKKNLAAKRLAMEKALDAYGKAAQYGVAEVTTAATYSMAELYRTLAKDLMESERPKNLKGEELEQYGVLLEEQAFPFEEKAIEIHEANIGRAPAGIYDAWVRKSFEELAKLKPARYAKTEIETALSALPSMSADPAASRQATPEQALEVALLENPANTAVRTQLGVAYRKSGRFKDAESAYGEALRQDANFAPAQLNLGVLYDLYLQDPQRALESYERFQQHMQTLSANGDDPMLKQVATWIAELKRRLGSNAAPQPAEAPTS